jgi:hypothetical protein
MQPCAKQGTILAYKATDDRSTLLRPRADFRRCGERRWPVSVPVAPRGAT